MSSLASGLTSLHGLVAYLVIAALIFGETAVFVGFVLPGEIAAILGGVLASRGHLSLPLLVVIVVVAAVTGPFVGYEVGRRLGDRLFAARALRRVRGGTELALSALGRRGGPAVFLGRFVAIVRAIMPAAAGAARVRYRTFALYNVLGGLIWGAGYCLLGYLAGSAYGAVERRVGAGLAIAIGAVVVIAAAAWAVSRHRAGARGHVARAPGQGDAVVGDAVVGDGDAGSGHPGSGEVGSGEVGLRAPGLGELRQGEPGSRDQRPPESAAASRPGRAPASSAARQDLREAPEPSGKDPA